MGKDWQPEKVSASSLIPVGGTNFANMNSVSQLNSLQDLAPGFHRATLDALKASGKVREDPLQVEHVTVRPSRILKNFGHGARVKDSKEGRKGVIIHANAGYTKQKHTPVHRVADSKGKSWLAKETDLKLIL